MAWAKLEKYYNILDETPIYYTAVALHPAYRWAWFERTWASHPDWIKAAKRKVQQVWDERYRDIDVLLDIERVERQQTHHYNPFEEHCDQSRYDEIEEEAQNNDPFSDEFDRWQQAYERSDSLFVIQYPIGTTSATTILDSREWLSTFSRYNPCLPSVKDCSQPQGRWLSLNGVVFWRKR